jgi:AcrR family transcriptional regulator
MALSERRRREKEARRGEILRAAARVFAARGIEGASMDGIAAEAELGKATLYYYFATKDELAHTVVGEAAERLFAGLATAEGAEGDLAGAVEGLLQSYARFAVDHPELLAVVAPHMARMHLSWSGPPDHGSMTPGHDAFLGRLDGLVADSAWAAHREALLDLLGDVLLALGQLFLAGDASRALARIPFYVDLVRRWRPEEDAR